MPEIRIQVANKIAINLTPGEVIVCGNSDYEIAFFFDAEWDAEPTRTARFTYFRNGRSYYKECTFQGSHAPVPILSGIREVQVGVYAGDLHTTTPVRVICKPSILCGDPVEQITQEEKAGLQSQVDTLALEVEDLKENGTGGKQPDWNQNDPAAPDYIRNRPFYSAEKWELAHEKKSVQFTYDSTAGVWSGSYSDWKGPFFDNYGEHRGRATCKLVVNGEEYIGTFNNDEKGYDYFGNPALICHTSHMNGYTNTLPDTGEDFVVVRCCASDMGIALKNAAPTSEVSLYISLESECVKIPSEYLPNGKPLLLNADSAETYLNDSSYGDEALEAIKIGRQILVRVPNADGGNFTAIYAPIMMYQVPNRANKYLYLFFLRDEKQDLSALLGQAAGTVQMPTYGQLKMLLSQEYNSNPLEA